VYSAPLDDSFIHLDADRVGDRVERGQPESEPRTTAFALRPRRGGNFVLSWDTYPAEGVCSVACNITGPFFPLEIVTYLDRNGSGACEMDADLIFIREGFNGSTLTLVPDSAVCTAPISGALLAFASASCAPGQRGLDPTCLDAGNAGQGGAAGATNAAGAGGAEDPAGGAAN
jgi:hypothetical protein